MRAIDKGPEPKALPAYRAVPGATYDGKDFTPVKDAIRDAILRDQFHLCCYCLRRISSETQPHPTKPDVPAVVKMKIEHWHRKTHFRICSSCGAIYLARALEDRVRLGRRKPAIRARGKLPLR